MSAELDQLRGTIAQSCRILARAGQMRGHLGHVSARVDSQRLLIRCRAEGERGLAFTGPEQVRLVTLDGEPAEPMDGHTAPKELPLHSAIYRARPDLHAVAHTHPAAALVCGLGGIQLRPIFGAHDIPALQMALAGVPVYPRAVLVHSAALGAEVVLALGARDVCLLRGHGVVAAGSTVEAATVRALTLEELASVHLALAQAGRSAPDLTPDELAELPDLGPAFNDRLTWQVHAANDAACEHGARSSEWLR